MKNLFAHSCATVRTTAARLTNPFDRSRKIVRLATIVGVLLVLFAIPCFATGGLDTKNLVDGVKTALQVILSLVGGGMAVFGIIHLVEAQSSQDPNAKSQAIKQLAVGIGVIVIGNILIPIFTSMISDALKETAPK